MRTPKGQVSGEGWSRQRNSQVTGRYVFGTLEISERKSRKPNQSGGSFQVIDRGRTALSLCVFFCLVEHLTAHR